MLDQHDIDMMNFGTGMSVQDGIRDINMQNITGVGGWAQCPELFEDPMDDTLALPGPRMDLAAPYPPPLPPVSRTYVPPQQPARQQTWAQVAHLPYQYINPSNIFQPPPTAFLETAVPPRGRPMGPRVRHLPVAIAPVRPQSPPIFRLDMRAETPLDSMLPENFAPLIGPFSGPLDHTAFMEGWLQQPMITAESTVVRGGVMSPMSPLSPHNHMLRSPAMSISGRSDRSSRRSRRENPGPHRCSHLGCGEGFGSLADLRKHVNSVHGRYEDRRYACAICQKRFQYPKDLDRHQSTHEPRKPKYWCPLPGCQYKTKGFTRKDNYERHMELHYRPDSGIGGITMSRTTSRT